VSKSPVMILKPLDEKKIIPIWIGMNEANAIALELEHINSPRPMTHDLLHTIVHKLRADVDKIVITDIVENTFYASLYLRNDDQVTVIDCRPSDGVAIALKSKAKIFVSREILETSLLMDFFSNFLDSEEKIDAWFNSLSTDDFGREQ
jgi:uncharacterized protein